MRRKPSLPMRHLRRRKGMEVEVAAECTHSRPNPVCRMHLRREEEEEGGGGHQRSRHDFAHSHRG